MNVCDCSFAESEVVGDCVMRNRTARTIPKSGNTCPNCKQPVEIGQRCIDHAGIIEDTGWFRRFHKECFELMEEFAERHCDGLWHYPFDLEEAAKHAVANGADRFWREWLEKYELTWAWSPEPLTQYPEQLGPPRPRKLRPVEINSKGETA